MTLPTRSLKHFTDVVFRPRHFSLIARPILATPLDCSSQRLPAISRVRSCRSLSLISLRFQMDLIGTDGDAAVVSGAAYRPVGNKAARCAQLTAVICRGRSTRLVGHRTTCRGAQPGRAIFPPLLSSFDTNSQFLVEAQHQWAPNSPVHQSAIKRIVRAALIIITNALFQPLPAYLICYLLSSFTMPTLDNLGKISAVTMVVYIPVLVIATILVCRHGFTRDAGWIFLAIFSLSESPSSYTPFRILLTHSISPHHRRRDTDRSRGNPARRDDAVHRRHRARVRGPLAAHARHPRLHKDHVRALISTSLPPLTPHSVQNSLPNPALFTRAFRLLGLLATIALALSIYGATETSPSTVSNGSTLRRVGSLLFLALYLLLAALHGYCWMNVNRLMTHRRTLLVAISSALPFLGIRVVYSILSAFSGALSFSGTATPNTGALAKFSMLTGEWPIYLCMSVLMELVVVVIYTTAGTRIPLQQDYVQQAKFADDEPLYGMGPHAGPAPYQAPYAAPYGGSPYAQQEHIAYAPPPRA